MRVIQLVPEYSRGGGEKIARTLHEHLRERGIESKLVIICGKRQCDDRSAIFLEGTSPWDLRAWWKFRSVLSYDQPFILHCHLFPAQVLGSLQRSRSCIVVATEHSTNNRRRLYPALRLVDRAIYPRFSRVVAISRGVQASLSQWCPSVSGKIECITNGVDVEKISFSETPPATLRFVSVGRLVDAKNFCLAIRAVAELVNSGRRVKYDIFGEGPERERLAAEIRRNQMGDFIHLRGWSTGVNELLCAYSALIVPSLWEGFGLVAVEAMAAGLPVVSSDVPGLSEVVNSKHKCTFSPNDHRDLYAALLRAIETGLLTSEAVRRDMRVHASEFTSASMVAKHLELYQTLERSP